MKSMVIVNFYKKYETSWEELQMWALDIIALFEKDVEDIDTGGIGVENYYEDYRDACMQGMKTFILQVLNEWELADIIIYNNNFYKKFDILEMDGLLREYQYPNLYKNTKELFAIFTKENLQLTPENFDYIYETFKEDVICNVSSFEYSINEIDDDGEY